MGMHMVMLFSDVQTQYHPVFVFPALLFYCAVFLVTSCIAVHM